MKKANIKWNETNHNGLFQFAFFYVWRACHISRVKIPRGVVIDEPKSDLQVSYREVWERGSNSEIVA